MSTNPPEHPCPAADQNMHTWVALGGGNSGIVGDRRHVYGFHRGAAYVSAEDYSRRRDPAGADGPFPDWGWCCAGDYRHGGDPKLRAMHAVLLTRLMDGDPAVDNVCEFIGQPWADKPVYYWALWNGRRILQRYTGSGHDMWSHVSTWRSKSGTVPNLWRPVAKPAATTPKPPAWPAGVAYFRASNRPKYSATVRAWQARMKQRGWSIKADGYYGPQSAEVARKFQREKKLAVDGLLGPITFRAAWTKPITK
jgi:hypothetical protein